jgi:hypothetical protein
MGYAVAGMDADGEAAVQRPARYSRTSCCRSSRIPFRALISCMRFHNRYRVLILQAWV